MKSKVRFIHASDLHLGSILHTDGRIPDELEANFKRATFNAFRRICDLALAYNIDFLLLAGDVYDRESRSVMANHFFNKQCRRLARKDIDVYMIAGNHDPLSDNRPELLHNPENVFVFPGERVGIEEVTDRRGNLIARILGQSYRKKFESSAMYQSYTVPDNNVINIGLLHTQLDPASKKYVPCTYSDLVTNNEIDYWALGHIHNCRLLHQEFPCIAYPGMPQGRNFGERGIGGCLLVTMEGKDSPGIKYLPVSDLIWHQLEISIRNIENIEDLIKIMIDKKANKLIENNPVISEDIPLPDDYRLDFIRGYVLRWVITGRGEIHHDLKDQQEEVLNLIKEKLREKLPARKPFLWTDSVELRTGIPVPDIERLCEENPVFAELEEVIDDIKNDTGLRKKIINKLGAIWENNPDHENRDVFKLPLTEERLAAIISQAGQRVIENLYERRRGNDN